MELINLVNISPKPLKRKLVISPNTIIKSVQFNMASNFVASFLAPNESCFFLNKQDPRLKNLSPEKLANFIASEQIGFLCLENVDENFCLKLLQNLTFKPKIYIISETFFSLKGFENKELLSLDFEEFLSNSLTKNISAQFDEFLKRGSLAIVQKLDDEERLEKQAQILKLSLKTETSFFIFCLLVEKTGLSLSLFQLFGFFKKDFKISKDLFYKTCYDLEEKSYIFSLAYFNKPSAPKKYYAFDFGLLGAISLKKNLAKTFENMVFLELKKRQKNIFYMDFIDFFILPSEGFVCMAFADYDKVYQKTQLILKHNKIKKITFITMGYEYKTRLNSSLVNAKSFWVWALEN